MADLTVPTTGATPNPFTPDAPAAAANDTSAAVGAYLKNTAATAQSNIALSVGANPDLEAELARLSKQTGVPIESARANPDAVKQTAAVSSINFDRLAKQFPA